jgi:hypothetical protein
VNSSSTTQEHFSLMGECLDPDLPEEEQIDVLATYIASITQR